MKRPIAAILLLAACQDWSIAPAEEPVYGEQPEALRPTEVTDDFLQQTAVASDVLFVIDASGSMSENAAKLAAEFDTFARWLQAGELDWHVGVVSLSGDPLPDGRLLGVPPWIERDTPYAAAEFADRVAQAQAVEGNDACETGLVATRRALTPPRLDGTNAGFLRDDALLTVIVASDEDDHGYDDACGDPWGEPEAFAEWALELKGGDPDKVTFGVIGMFDEVDPSVPTDCDLLVPEAPVDDAGAVYAQVLRRLPGTSWSICSDDWSPFLDRLGLASAGLRRVFDLRHVPPADVEDQDGDGDVTEPALRVELDAGSGFEDVQPVWAERPDPDHAWDYDRVRNAVVFTTATMPDEGQRLRAIYPNAAER